MGEFAATIDNKGAQRVNPRPMDTVSSSYGSYELAQSTGTMAAGIAANSQIWQFRWAPSSQNDIAVIRRVSISAVVLGTGFTAGTALFELKFSRSNTAAGSGGAAATISGNNAKKRTSMATTKLAEARIATTGALTAATETLDTQAIRAIVTELPTTADIVLLADTDFVRFRADEYGLVLAYQEGLVVRATVPATGTWRAAISVEWDECHKGAY